MLFHGTRLEEKRTPDSSVACTLMQFFQTSCHEKRVPQLGCLLKILHPSFGDPSCSPISMCSRAYCCSNGCERSALVEEGAAHSQSPTASDLSVSALAFLRAAVPKVTVTTGNIDFQYLIGRHHVMKGSIVPRFIASDKMLADGLTKPYSRPEIQTYLPETGDARKGLEKEQKEWNLEVVVLTSCLALLAPIISTVPPSVPPHTTNPLPLDMGSSLFMLRACSGTSRQHPGAHPPLHSQFDLC
jgi:hypothetical protein